MSQKKIKQNKSETKEEKTDNQTEKLEELNNKYLRALADYQNLEKRLQNEKVESEKRVKRQVLEKFLSVMDDLQKAEVFIQDDGLKMIMNRFKTALADLGLEELDLVGKEYDPFTAEAVDIVQGEKDNIVVEIVRKGYTLGDDVLRPAQVKVSKSAKN